MSVFAMWWLGAAVSCPALAVMLNSRTMNSLHDVAETRGSVGIMEFNEEFEPNEACRASGVFTHQHGNISFFVTDAQVSLGIDPFPPLTLTYEKGSTPNIASVQFGDEKLSFGSARSDDPTLSSISKGVSRAYDSPLLADRAKLLSDHLGSHGWDGGQRPCAQKLHMMLLAFARVSGKSTSVEKWGPYGMDDQCPKKFQEDWECQVTRWWPSKHTEWVPPGHSILDVGAHDSITQDLQCRPVAGSSNVECEGLCGAKCDCWESICGSDYLCEYNPVCCAHDKVCGRDGMVSSGCLNSFVNDACSNEGLKKWGPGGTEVQ